MGNRGRNAGANPGRVVGNATASAFGRLRNRAGGFTTNLARARANNRRRARPRAAAR